MRSTAYVIALALCTALAVCAVTPAQKGKTTSTKKTAKKSTAKSPKSGSKTGTGKQTASRQTSSSKSSTKKNLSKKTASSYRRSSQREPDAERYKEIQQSLANKGYFTGPVNGTWGSESVEALKRFQRDQHIDDDGKLGSLSLIALGLGPKRGGTDSGPAEKPADRLPVNSPLPEFGRTEQ